MRITRLTLAVALGGLFGSLLLATSPASAADGPANLRMVWRGATNVKVAWDAVVDATGYQVSYAKAADFDPETGTKKDTTSTSLVIGSLTKATTYYVRVRATTAAAPTDWSGAAKIKTGPLQLRIGSFNVKDPEASAKGPCKLWNSGRSKLVAKDIVDSKVDVLGVQEVYEESDRESLLRALRAAGGSQYVITPDITDSRLGWDNRLLYDPNRVTLLESGSVRFDRQDPETSQDRQFVWGKFELITNHRPFLVYTTHVQPGGTDTLKLAQINQIRSHAVTNGVKKSIPVFITGDMNTSKFDGHAKTMLANMKSAGFGDVLGQTAKSYSVSGQRAKSRTNAYYNSYNGCSTRPSKVDKARIGNNVDWIFATNSLEIPAWKTWVHVSGSAAASSIPSDHWLLTIQALLP